MAAHVQVMVMHTQELPRWQSVQQSDIRRTLIFPTFPPLSVVTSTMIGWCDVRLDSVPRCRTLTTGHPKQGPYAILARDAP